MFTLAEDTHCPFNSQNTTFETSLLPCSYLLVTGDEYRGALVSRYDDIWMSYFWLRNKSTPGPDGR